MSDLTAARLGKHKLNSSAEGGVRVTAGGCSKANCRFTKDDKPDWSLPNPSSSKADAHRRPRNVHLMVSYSTSKKAETSSTPAAVVARFRW